MSSFKPLSSAIRPILGICSLRQYATANKFKLILYGSRDYDVRHLTRALNVSNIKDKVSVTYEREDLLPETVEKAREHDAVCTFVNSDCWSSSVLRHLKQFGIRLIVQRCVGTNNVDFEKTKELGIKVTNVPAYSPYGVAEFGVACLLMLQRKIHLARQRVRQHNFCLEGLEGFELSGKTVGVIGFGRIGESAATIYRGFGCKVVGFDTYHVDRSIDLGVFTKADYIDQIYSQCDIITIHAPLNAQNHHMINEEAIRKMKNGVYIVNLGRGGLIDSKALLEGLKSGKVGGACLDVYEHEAGVFYHDRSHDILHDDTLSLLIGFPNVIVTSHQAFLTNEALTNIADETVKSIKEFIEGSKLTNEVRGV